MREFFRGWKRKVGVVMLLFACVLMMGWVRSKFRMYEASMPIGRHVLAEIISEREYLFVGIERDDTCENGWNEFRLGSEPTRRFPQKQIAWLWCFGIGWGRDYETVGRWIDRDAILFICPYWSIVIPLTAISAWLLLSKPRPAKPPAIETAE
jgi:hypothetical protein